MGINAQRYESGASLDVLVECCYYMIEGMQVVIHFRKRKCHRIAASLKHFS